VTIIPFTFRLAELGIDSVAESYIVCYSGRLLILVDQIVLNLMGEASL